MDHSYSNTKPHQKGKRLKLNDRTTILALTSQGCAITRALNCSPSTV
ncbi:helix-turn-helix domain-containing protein, partial [Lactobacillus delbrueckii]